MNGEWSNLQCLAEGKGRLWPLIVILVIAGVFKIISMIKAKWDQEQARRVEQESERSGGGREPAQRQDQPARQGGPADQPSATPAAQAVAALREVLGMQAPAAPKPPPPPPSKTLRRSRPLAQAKLEQRLGDGVRAEVLASERHLTAEQARRRKRLARVKSLQPGIVSAGVHTGVERKPKVRVPVSRRDDLVRGIIYAEILGPPKALRRSRESWDA